MGCACKTPGEERRGSNPALGMASVVQPSLIGRRAFQDALEGGGMQTLPFRNGLILTGGTVCSRNRMSGSGGWVYSAAFMRRFDIWSRDRQVADDVH